MRSNTTRIFIVIASLLIAVIIGVQVHWLKKTYLFEENEFNVSVVKSIRGVYEDMKLVDEPGNRLDQLIQKPNPHSYIFQIDSIPPRDSLLYFLRNEFDDFKVYADCKIALYNDSNGHFLYEEYIPAAASVHTSNTQIDLLPVKKNFNYVYLYFPSRDKYIISQMNNWILASVLLLLLLIGFAFSVYYLFQQKFLVEVQKDFINNVTHEFSTPLSVIELSLDGLEKPAIRQQPEKFEKYLTAIKYQSDYLNRHIANLVSTIVAGNYHSGLKKSGVVPDKMLKKAVAQLEPLLTKKAGTVEWNLEGNNTTIQADEDNLYLALFNIISNAIKYSALPGIIIGTSVQDNKYSITIKDNGTGIESSQQKNIFKKFYRVQKGNVHNVKGLGLGLYFAKQIIDGHKGKIHVSSIPGMGAEFKIELPVNNA
jgi:two-component system, OmpR family, phosphate regulon sensor histidine kinase PhoR